MKHLFTLVLIVGLGTFSYNSAFAQVKNYNSSKTNTSKVEGAKKCKKSCCKKAKKGTAKSCAESCCKKAPKSKGKKAKKTKVSR